EQLAQRVGRARLLNRAREETRRHRAAIAANAAGDEAARDGVADLRNRDVAERLPREAGHREDGYTGWRGVGAAAKGRVDGLVVRRVCEDPVVLEANAVLRAESRARRIRVAESERELIGVGARVARAQRPRERRRPVRGEVGDGVESKEARRCVLLEL